MAVSNDSNITAQQPQGSIEMVTTSAPPANNQQPSETKPMRLRGGGAGKSCLVGACACFVCFECCEGCVECFADIICCPCEMCC